MRCELLADLHISQPAQHIVEVGNNHEQEQDADADVFSPDHELLAWHSARYHLVDEEQDVSAIKSRDRKNVHESKDD